MAGDVTSSSWRGAEVSPLIQNIALYGAAMCIAALCSAFVFDYTFWLIIDPRMLSYFVLADHIQTAVHIFGLISLTLGAAWILTLVLVYAGMAVTRSDQFRKVAAALLLIVLCLIGLAIAATGLSWVNLFDRATVVVMSAGLLGMVVLGLLFYPGRGSSKDGSGRHRRPPTARRVFWSIVSVFLFLTMADAMVRAFGSGNAAPTHDVVRLEGDSKVTGHVVRLVDRGVILRDQKDGRVVFVPKEKVRRIDHHVPPGSES